MVLSNRLWRVPLVVWGVLALILAIVWLVVWPSDMAAGASTVQFVVLRWFHAIVWLLLSAAAFVAASPGGARWARAICWGALATYAVFVAVMLTIG